MKKQFLAPVIAVALAGGFFAVSAVSAASAEETPAESIEQAKAESVAMHVGPEPVFYSAEKGSELFLSIVNSDPALTGFDTSVATSGAQAMFPAVDEEGIPIEYEVGYVESVAATASRCIQLSGWTTDPAVTDESAQALADEQFETYASEPAIAELSNVEEMQSNIEQLARDANEMPVDIEVSEVCGAFGTEGAAQ
ncbi:hypothetical protein [Leucobacter manosquensis]|uniref:Uncharacterized protein n=1 Tax=Leucobacter manosquensis TaxID=2810611 RepID=A0ABS5M5B2_9MICO|nr:hypothetical protein [Leucobacter manosquensis]MBS3182376.1 hypothetical protein [Leucobacter manosquensis]